MAGSLDKVLQPDGSYKWEEVKLVHSTKPVEPEVCPAPEKAILTANLKTMTKSELEVYGRSIGIELDKRQNKLKLISELETFIASK